MHWRPRWRNPPDRLPTARMPVALSALSPLSIALAVSVAAHAVLLTVRFVDPEGFNRFFDDTPLEVILVNARVESPPDSTPPQAIAQATLAGGGEAESGRATSPLLPSPQAEEGDAQEDSRARIERLQDTQQQLLTQVRRELAAMPAPEALQDDGSPEERAQEEHRRQLVELLAEIEKRVNDANARPKKRYISPATQEAVYALYYDQLRRKIEQRGTLSFPEQGGQKLYGELTIIITVDASGRVTDTKVVQPSSSRVLDRQAVAIVRASAPFGRFTAKMRREYEFLVITSKFRFSREDGIEASFEDSAEGAP